MNGAQALVEMLIAYDSKVIFGLPGDTTVDLYDVLRARSLRLDGRPCWSKVLRKPRRSFPRHCGLPGQTNRARLPPISIRPILVRLRARIHRPGGKGVG